jgi:hypothetical protein
MKIFKKHYHTPFNKVLTGSVALIFDRHRWTVGWQNQTGYRIGETIGSISTLVSIKLTLNFHKN